jgi:anti-sigma regulatory factor (Ser/Thr protein kinase)
MPLFVTQEFRREPVAVQKTRSFVRQTLNEWAIPERADDIETCVSELVTNAVRHDETHGRSFLFTLSGSDGLVRIEVHDASRRRPKLPSPDTGSVTGRGLLLVDRLADGWGVEPRDPSGKIVWAEFKITTRRSLHECQLITPRLRAGGVPSPGLIASLAAWHWIDETAVGSVAFLLLAHSTTTSDVAADKVPQAMRAVAACLALGECSMTLPDIGPRLHMHGHDVFLRLDWCEYLLCVPIGGRWATFARTGGTVAVAVGLDPLPSHSPQDKVTGYMAASAHAGRLFMGKTRACAPSPARRPESRDER